MTLATTDLDEAIKTGCDDAERALLALEKIALEKSFHEYAKAAWHLIEPGVPFVDNWHVERMCTKLERCYYGKEKRVIFNVPPGTSKSRVVSVLFPTWVWAKSARKRFMTASYGASLSTRDALLSRQIIESDWYQARWPVKLMDDQNAKTRYNTNEHGWRFSTSVNGAGTGEHPDFILIDDPHTAEEAASDVERKRALAWFDSTVSMRLGRNPAIVVIMQRLHQEDLSGHLLDRGGWTHVCYPMQYEKCACEGGDPKRLTPQERCVLHRADENWQPDPTDPRTKQGEVLDPVRFPPAKLAEMKLNLGEYGVAGQLQQRPAPVGGGLFKMEWFKYVDVAPALMRQARGWDTAGTEDDGDYTATVKCGEEFEKDEQGRLTSVGRFYFMEPHHDQIGPDAVDRLIKTTADRDGKNKVAQREEKEGGSSGLAVIQARAKRLAGHNYAGVTVTGNKRARAKPLRSQCEAGNVYLVGSGWAEFLRQLCNFPNADHDDYMDAASCAFNAVLLEEPPAEIRIRRL